MTVDDLMKRLEVAVKRGYVKKTDTVIIRDSNGNNIIVDAVSVPPVIFDKKQTFRYGSVTFKRDDNSAE